MRRLRRNIGIALLGAGVGLGSAARAGAAALDASGDITLGVRTYAAARVGTQDTDISIIYGTPLHNRQTFRSLTFPVSADGHLRQSRFFAEAELRHNLDRLIKDGFGPLALLNDLPFTLRNVKYSLTYRGAYDGVYDYGPAEYSTAYQYYNQTLLLPFNNKTVNPFPWRNTLRNVASERQQLFLAYVEADAGPIYLRFGRQILAWGETDAFRLLDNINPIDNSFGGFLIPLDERRVPLDMLRASYKIPDFSFIPFHEMFIEGYAAIDNATSINPGIPNGSPWQLPNLLPSATLQTTKDIPPEHPAYARRRADQVQHPDAAGRASQLRHRALLHLPRRPGGADLRQPAVPACHPGRGTRRRLSRARRPIRAHHPDHRRVDQLRHPVRHRPPYRSQR